MSDLHSQLLQEYEQFCARYPEIDELDILTTGITPTFWGKRYPLNKLPSLIGEYKMPRGGYLMSPIGEYVEVMHYNYTDGDPDSAFEFIPGTLQAVPWQGKHRAQIMVTTGLTDTPFEAEPRVVLQNVLEKLKANHFSPTVAFELEFYLIDKNRSEHGLIQTAQNPVNGRADNTYMLGMDRLDMFADVLRDIQQSCAEQGIITTALSAEIGGGQYEINLHHHTDCLKAADEALMFKRVVSGVARQHGYEATFMAKPFLGMAGNGMHLHVSMYDEDGNNQLAKNNHAMLHHAIGGCLQTMPAAIAYMAPNPNAYRRYTPHQAIATQICWAHENRTVAVRVPQSDEDNIRIEYRIASADSNPYLILAAVLAGMHWGIEQQADPGEPYDGYACTEHGFPRNLRDALTHLEQDNALQSSMGDEFCQLYLAFKRSELEAFEDEISAREYAWYV